MIGECFGNYRVVRVLGQGGMGIVYVAEHTLLGRKAVVKQLLPELSSNLDIVQRFFNEARAATMIRHPGIVDVFDFGQHSSGSAFIAMEFLDGESLGARLQRERAFAPDLAMYIARQIASPLGAAHAVGIVHRDLKPDNVFLSPDPDAPYGLRIKVLDFGIAKLADQMSAGGVKTRTGALMGTPTYMAPEQCHGAADLDYRADLYSLGCILFEMLCGRPPFTGQGLGELLGAHMFEPPIRPSTIVQLPVALDELVLALLAKAPAARPAGTDRIIAALDAIRREQGSSPIGSPPALGMMATALPSAHSLPGGSVSAPMSAPTTTLGGSAGMIDARPTAQTAARRRPWLWAIPIVAATAGVVIVARVRSHASAPDPSVAAPAAAPASAVAAPTTAGSGASDAACDGGDVAKCVDAGLAALHATPPQTWHARDLFDKGCTRGQAAACGHLARLFLRGADGVAVDASRAVSAATRGCEAGDGDACAMLALAAARGDGMSPDVAASSRAAKQACTAGVGLGCAIAADIAAIAGDAGQASTLSRSAAPALASTCTAGDDLACIAYADLLVRGRVARDLATAVKVLQAACDHGSGEACVRLAQYYDLGLSVTPDPVRSRELEHRARTSLEAACDLGRGTACAAVGRELAFDHTSSRDPERAASLLGRACDAGEGDGCVVLARMTEIGDGAVKSDAHAGELYRRARTLLSRRCMVADIVACNQAGKLFVADTGGAKDLPRAAELFHRACVGGSGDGCVGWSATETSRAAAAFKTALEIANPACTAGDASACDLSGDVRCMGPKELADPAACVASYRKSCDAGLPEGCFDLAWTASNGVGGPRDAEAARRYYELGCRGEHGPSCNNLAWLRVDAKDAAGAATLFQAGCDDGDAASCANLADQITRGKISVKDPRAAAVLTNRACVLGRSESCN